MPNDERRRSQWRIQSSKIFLTYPRCGERAAIESFLKQLPNIRCFIVASEYHSNGQPHCHAFVEFSSKLHTRNERYFDVAGHHPNVQSCRSKNAVLEYVTKDSDYIALKKMGSDWEKWKLNIKRTWKDLIEQSGTADEFMESAKTEFPRDFVLQNDRLQLFADKYYCQKSYESRYTVFNLPIELNCWKLLELETKPERPKGNLT